MLGVELALIENHGLLRQSFPLVVEADQFATFGKHVAIELNSEDRRQLWIPRGMAHGFVVLSKTADFFYKCDEFYSPTDARHCRRCPAPIDPKCGIVPSQHKRTR